LPPTGRIFPIIGWGQGSRLNDQGGEKGGEKKGTGTQTAGAGYTGRVPTLPKGRG